MYKLKEGKPYRTYDFLVMAFRIAPILSTVKVLNRLLSAMMPSFTVLATAGFIDTALGIFSGSMQRDMINTPLILLFLITLYQNVNTSVMSFVELRIGMVYVRQLRVAAVEKRAKLAYRHIENNDTWDLITRTCRDMEQKCKGGFDNILGAADIVVRVFSLLIILMTQVWWAGILITAVCIPLFFLAGKAGKASYEAAKEGEKHLRRSDYLKKVLIDRENIEERALFGYTEAVSRQWHARFESARVINLKVELINYVRMKGSSLITVLISLFIIGILLIPLAEGTITSGMFMGLVGATLNLVQMMSWELSYTMKELTKNREYLKDLTTFCALTEQEGALELPGHIPDADSNGVYFEELEFREVSFRYPDTDKYILKNFNLKLVKNRHYAVVGTNGAGKTTITKILTGLYDNFEGDVLINGKSIREYRQAELKRMFSVVYQDFAKYFISLEDNIALGNVRKRDAAAIKEQADSIGLSGTIAKLPEGMQTALGKIKTEGMDLSGGEWQRLAIARALYNPAEIRILDEPTAALDPVAESTIYEMFGQISAGKSTIFITHRLGAAKLADEIIVIADGKAAEQGSHEALIGQGGIYAEMFESQRSWYQ